MIELQLEVRGPCDVHSLRLLVATHFGCSYAFREGLFGDVVITVPCTTSSILPALLDELSEHGISWTLKANESRVRVTQSV